MYHVRVRGRYRSPVTRRIPAAINTLTYVLPPPGNINIINNNSSFGVVYRIIGSSFLPLLCQSPPSSLYCTLLHNLLMRGRHEDGMSAGRIASSLFAGTKGPDIARCSGRQHAGLGVYLLCLWRQENYVAINRPQATYCGISINSDYRQQQLVRPGG